MMIGKLSVAPMAIVAGVALGSAPASAECISTKRPYTLSGDTVVASDVVDSKSTCRHPQKVPPNKQLTGVTVVSPPKHGKLTQGGKYVIYTPAAGFTGDDSHTVKICGGDASGQGCSTVTYNTRVN